MKTSIPFLICLLALACTTEVFAAKEVFQRTKPHCNVGTIGHIDHGKTTLTLALAKAAGAQVVYHTYETTTRTGSDSTDALILDLTVANDEVIRVRDFSDTEAAFRMIPDAYADGAILVVSAADGPMPQTREHVLLARQVGVPSVVVFLNLDGGLYNDQVDRSEDAVRDLLTSAGYDGRDTLVVRGSAAGALRGEEWDLHSLSLLIDAIGVEASSR